MPSKYDIAEHWLREGSNLHRQFGKAFIIDLGEPSCMACGQHWHGRYDAKNPDSVTDCRRAWNDIPLEKAHVVPKALGGKNTPDNLILLCKDCHSKAPDVVYPEYMIKWCLAQKSYVEELFGALQAAGINESPLRSESMRALAICGTHGAKIKFSSFAFALRHVMDERKVKGQLSLF